MAANLEKRLTVIETLLPNLATKEDIHNLESAFVKWGAGLAMAIVGLLIGYLSLSKAPPATTQQPIVIQLPASLQPTPPAPAGQAGTAPN